jgi:hypothetical protein
MVEVGTAEAEPLSDPVLDSGSWVALWLLLLTMQHPITQHPATATPLLQPHPPLGTGAIHISNITRMSPVAQLHGGRSSSKTCVGLEVRKPLSSASRASVRGKQSTRLSLRFAVPR